MASCQLISETVKRS